MPMALADARRIQRLYDRVLATRKNCSYEDLKALLLAVGFTVRNGKGSHRAFKRGPVSISITERKPVKEIYVAQVIAIVDGYL